MPKNHGSRTQKIRAFKQTIAKVKLFGEFRNFFWELWSHEYGDKMRNKVVLSGNSESLGNYRGTWDQKWRPLLPLAQCVKSPILGPKNEFSLKFTNLLIWILISKLTGIFEILCQKSHWQKNWIHNFLIIFGAKIQIFKYFFPSNIDNFAT